MSSDATQTPTPAEPDERDRSASASAREPADTRASGTPRSDAEETAKEAPDKPEEFERPGGLLSDVDPHLVLYHDPQCLHAEQYRSFRTNLAALNRTGGPRSVVITSSMKGEGKSVTAANLAACLAELPATRVCLLDTDFRAPSQAALYGIEHGPGLSELLSDELSLKAVVKSTVVPGLDLIRAGREPPNPARLLGSDRFTNLLAELKRRYTWVVLDTPPVSPYTDACVLSAICDGAILVIRIQETPRALAQSTERQITSAGGRLLGCFLAGLSPDRDDAERKGYYRVDAGARELAKQERARIKARREAERQLRKQERAYRKRLKRAQKADQPDDL